jgi:hypothetical protein
MVGGTRSGGALVVAEHFFAFEGDFLAFEVEGGEFFNGAEDVAQFGAAGFGADEFEGFLVQEMVDGGLDALGLRGWREVALQVDDGVEDFGGATFGVGGGDVGAEAANGGEADFESESLGSGCVDAVVDDADVLFVFELGEDFAELSVIEAMQEGVAALLAFEGLGAIAFDEVDDVIGRGVGRGKGAGCRVADSGGRAGCCCGLWAESEDVGGLRLGGVSWFHIDFFLK